jgi:oligoribonuclease NrnB/cAMP/cGMP phosphodiesterase (DHH superfamily)
MTMGGGGGMRLYCITHSSDLDGMASAALLVRQYRMPISHVFFGNYNFFKSIANAIDSIKGSGKTLVISDLAVDVRKGGSILSALRRFRKRENYVIWLDHHPWADSSTEMFSKVCDILINGEMDRCGTELVYAFMCDRDKFCDRLVRNTHVADFVDTCVFKHRECLLKRGRKLGKVRALRDVFSKDEIRTMEMLTRTIKVMRKKESPGNPRLRKLVAAIAKDGADNPLTRSMSAKYVSVSKPHIDALMKNIRAFYINGRKIALGTSRKISNQDASTKMLYDLKADIAVYVNGDTGHASVRSKVGVPSRFLAEKLGGGGHDFASSFAIRKNQVNEKGMGRLEERIREIAQKGLR